MLTGVSSPHITGSARSAVFIAASNPAAGSRWENRSRARATNPLETGTPSSASITVAVRSTGTLPSLASSTAAALRFGPYTTAPACPNGTAAVVVLRQQPHRRRGRIQWTFSSSIGGMSQICVQLLPAPSAAPVSSAPHPEHSAGGSACSVRPGSRAGSSPDPGWPGWPPGVRSLDRTRCETAFFRLALASIESFDGGIEEFVESFALGRASGPARPLTPRSVHQRPPAVHREPPAQR